MKERISNVKDGRFLSILILMTLFFLLLAGGDVYAATSPVAKGTVKGKSAAAYEKASRISAKKKVLYQKDTFEISKEVFTSKSSTKAAYHWYYCGKYVGYFRSDKVKFTPKTKVSATVAKKVAARKGAGGKFKKVKTYAKGKKLLVVAKAEAKNGKLWYRVKDGDKYYYVFAEYVSMPEKVSEEPKKSDEKKDSDPANKKEEKTSESTKQDSSQSGGTAGKPAASNIDASFPDTYKTALKQIAKDHPNWVFKPLNTGLTWNQASSKMCENPGANTVWYSWSKSFRSSEKGYYNYLKDSYTPKDGNHFYAASPQAVKYYMDPRNFFDDSHIFLFEDERYQSSYQTLDAVKSVFSGRNTTLYNNAGSFVAAAKQYNINAIYLASKALEEQGSTVASRTVGGKKVYNVFNIGASDSKSGGITNGMNYARYGLTYGRPWTSIDKSIKGGAQYIAQNFISNDQNLPYLEHFNVMNGLSKVGTHVYMTAVYAPSNTAVSTAKSYEKYGIIKKKIVFYIPVYKGMPSSNAKKPGSSQNIDNNFYLKSLSIDYQGASKTLIKSSALNYNQSFTVRVPNGTTKVKLNGVKASKTSAKISGLGTQTIQVGTTSLSVVVTASSGEKRVYTVKVERSK